MSYRPSNAVLLAALLVVFVELVLRIAGPEHLVAYVRGGIESRDMIRRHVLANGSPDVLFIGSSRTENAIVIPEAQASIEGAGLAGLTVASFATAGAQVLELLSLVRFLQREGELPDLLFFGVSPQQLRGSQTYLGRAANYWTLADYWEARRTAGPAVDRYVPQVLRNGIERVYFTMRARGRIDQLAIEQFRPPHSFPILGGHLQRWNGPGANQIFDPTAQQVEQMAEFVMAEYLDPDGSFRFTWKALDQFESLAMTCQQAAVPIVFFELPNSGAFLKLFPADTRERFIEFFRGLEDRYPHASFVGLSEMGLEFEPHEFRDSVHLGYSGAHRMTEAFIEHALLPRLTAQEQSSAGD